MDNERIAELAKKYLDGFASDSEIQELHNWYDNWDDDEEEVITSQLADEGDVRKKILDRLMQKINTGKKDEAKVFRINHKEYRFAAVAATVLILLGIGVYFKFFDKPINDLAANKLQPTKNDIAPGGNKAILKLANGTKIILDSAREGTLTQQGYTKVVKLYNGMLAYQPTGKEQARVVGYDTLTTPRGGQFELKLPDGSKVWLNAASSIRYPTAFEGKERLVEITGEIYFEVVHNAAMPFKVRINTPSGTSSEVEVLGTHFNINAYGDEANVKTTLLQGSVRMKDIASGNSEIIKPGQQAQLSGASLTINNNVDINKIMAWKSGFFEFDDINMATVMKQLSRWYDIDVSFEGDISQEKFGGRISRNLPLSKVLKLLEENNVNFKLDGRRLINSRPLKSQ